MMRQPVADNSPPQAAKSVERSIVANNREMYFFIVVSFQDPNRVIGFRKHHTASIRVQQSHLRTGLFPHYK